MDIEAIRARLQTLLEAVEDGEYVVSPADDGLVYKVYLSQADADRLINEPLTTPTADLAALLAAHDAQAAHLAAAQAEAARLRAALAKIHDHNAAWNSDQMSNWTAGEAAAALAAPSPAAERGAALLGLVAAVCQELIDHPGLVPTSIADAYDRVVRAGLDSEARP